LAQSKSLKNGVMMMAADTVPPESTRCASSQDIRGERFQVDLSRTARYVTVAASPENCTSNTTATIKRALIPSTTTLPCTNNDWAKIANGGVLLVSRHVQCAVFIDSNFDITGADDTNYGTFRWEVRVNSYGPANGLNKTFAYSSRLSRIALAAPERAKRSDSLPTLRFQPTIGCDSTQDSSAQCQINVPVISVNALARIPSDPNIGWSSPSTAQLNLSWIAGDGTYTEFRFGTQELYFAKPGYSVNVNGPYRSAESLGFSSLRCDKKMAVNGGSGCVYPAAPAVFVLSAMDPAVKEAAEHIREAQQEPLKAPGGLEIDAATGVAIARSSNALQRTRVTGLKGRSETALQTAADGANRQYSCKYSDSIIKLIPKSSSTCPIDGVGCDCDEYPFNSTWNGSYLMKSTTSAKFINPQANQLAGTRIQQFYQAERVLDYTVDPGIVFNQNNAAASVPIRAGGDDFWVHIE
jgi:Deoxyribonuclease NucA/NucB